METVFKKIHEGLDLFNYYFSRHEASSNDSQREKLETDLKKEIKKLQKFRDQIKNWQGNDSLEATIAPLKLQEHRRLVEEAMECYKEVEKNSKMKSYSNQSIMLASRDKGDHDMSPEVEEAYDWLSGVSDELSEQNEKLDEEYEKLSQKKVRKNNQLAIEERKQELESFKLRNEFHMEKIEAVMSFLKSNKIAVELVLAIQEDLNFYVESNQEPDFVDDDTLYDELIKEARENYENNTVVTNAADDSVDVTLINGDTTADVSSSQVLEHAAPAPAPKKASSASPVPANTEIPSKTDAVTPKGKAAKSEFVDSSSPAFITTLKPASTPSKPVGALKWSIAAAGAAQNSDTSASKLATPEKSETKQPELSKESSAETKPTPPSANGHSNKDESNASSELLSLLTKSNEYSPYLEVLKNSKLTAPELDVFSDLNLLRAPSGIQEFVVAFAATNKAVEGSKLLKKTTEYNVFTDLIQKPYLPKGVLGQDADTIKAPLFLGKLQSYWNRIRASNKFDDFLLKIESLEAQSTTESTSMASELTMVLFYGYYYGYLPLENIISESLLHKLGWVPYGLSTDADVVSEAPKQFQYWFKKVHSATDDSLHSEVGDFRVFDLHSWEIYVKYGFKFDARLSRAAPSRSLF